MEKKFEIKRSYVLIFLALIISSFVWTGVFLSRNNSLKEERDLAVLNADSLLSAKLLLNKKIDDANVMLSQYLKEKENAASKNASLDEDIKAKTSQIEKLTKNNYSVTALRKQIKDAKKQKEDCESRMNSLNQRIQELEGAVSQLDKQLTQFKDENESLKRKLEWAREVKAKTISVKTLYVKSKPKETSKAKRINRVAATVDLMENQVTEPGSKKVYMVVYAGNKILSAGKDKFTERKSNVEMNYSSMKEINYTNRDQKVIISYDLEQKLIKGKYKVEIYVDGSLAGKTDFTLQ